VHNNIEWQPTWGAMQNADFTLSSGRGNSFDIASLTIPCCAPRLRQQQPHRHRQPLRLTAQPTATPHGLRLIFQCYRLGQFFNEGL